jgi:hypothetical protein
MTIESKNRRRRNQSQNRHDSQHHVLLGHLDDYESYNLHVLEFVKNYSSLTSQQIRADPEWQKAVAGNLRSPHSAGVEMISINRQYKMAARIP